MIKDLEKRADFWSQNRSVEQMSDSLVCPFEEHLDDFKDKHVLEIGPGGGRQFGIVYPLAVSYVVADISDDVLSDPLYRNIVRFNIVDYKYTTLPKSFDVVHFWYVLHHVQKEELNDFFGFVSRHLVEGGIALFNTAPLDYPEGGHRSDGILTTKFTPDMVRKALKKNGFSSWFETEINEKSIGIVFRAVKGDNL